MKNVFISKDSYHIIIDICKGSHTAFIDDNYELKHCFKCSKKSNFSLGMQIFEYLKISHHDLFLRLGQRLPDWKGLEIGESAGKKK